MNETQEQRDDWLRTFSSRQYEVNMIRLAHKHRSTWSEFHPDNIRKRIAYESSLLEEAMKED